MLSSTLSRSVALAAVALGSGALLLPMDAGKTPASAKPAQRAKTQIIINKIAPRADDVSSIDGMIKAYYDVVSGPAGQPRQWNRDATLYISGVRFVVITEDKEGNASAISMTHQEFVDASEAEMGGKPFYEREKHRVIHRVGNVAHVLSTAEQAASADGPYRVSGLDSIELFFDGKRWWIASANLWPINAKLHPLPPEYLPE